MSSPAPPSVCLPDLDERATWSVHVLDGDSGAVLASHEPDRQGDTASIGKIFLLVEVATRFEDGTLDPAERLVVPDELRVRDSGLLHLMQDQDISCADAALLVGSVSDNLATNALLARCGLDEVRAVARELGMEHTSQLDYLRDHRLRGMPWAASYGTARELAALLQRLGREEVRSPAVSRQVMDWLAAGVDTSMVAQGFLLDPLAHQEDDGSGLLLRHKTGSDRGVRADVGWVRDLRSDRSLSYAVLATWSEAPGDLRQPVLDTMNRIGRQLRDHLGRR